MKIVKMRQLRVGMKVRTACGKRAWRVASIGDNVAGRRWVILELPCVSRDGHRYNNRRYISEADVQGGWLQTV